MDDLEHFVLNELPQSEAVLQELEESVVETLRLFGSPDAFDNQACWKLQLSESGIQVAEKQLSQSTTSMILMGIITALRPQPECASSSYRWESILPTVRFAKEDSDDLSRLSEHVKHATDRLQAEWTAKGEGTKSRTFGTNDILSLSWHYDLFAERNEAITIKILDHVTRRAIEFAKGTEIIPALRRVLRDKKPMETESTYVLLRFARLLRRLEKDGRQEGALNLFVHARDKMASWFEPRLHEQLSFSEIPDSSFDPAELAFCLEGLLLLRPTVIDYALIDLP